MHIHTLFSLDVIASEDDGYPSAGGVGAPLLKSAPLREKKERPCEINRHGGYVIRR